MSLTTLIGVPAATCNVANVCRNEYSVTRCAMPATFSTRSKSRVGGATRPPSTHGPDHFPVRDRSSRLRVSHIETRIGTSVTARMNTATTFVTGLSRGRVSWLSIQMGTVCC